MKREEQNWMVRPFVVYSIFFTLYLLLFVLEEKFEELGLKTEDWLCEITIAFIVAFAAARMSPGIKIPKYFPFIVFLMTLIGLGLLVRYIMVIW